MDGTSDCKKNVWKINQDKQCNDKYMCVGKKIANTDASWDFNVCQPHFVTVCMHVSIYCVQNRKDNLRRQKKREWHKKIL